MSELEVSHHRWQLIIFVFARFLWCRSGRARSLASTRPHAVSMAASPDVEADLLSEGSPLRSPSPEAGVGDDIPAEPHAPEPRGDDSESEDDDRRRVKRGRDEPEPEPEPEPDAPKRRTLSTHPGGGGGRGRGLGDQPLGGRGAIPHTAGPASGRGGSGAPAGRGGRGGRGPSPPFQRASSRDRFANSHGGDGERASYPGHVEVTRVFPVLPDRRSGPSSRGHVKGADPSSGRRGGPPDARNAPPPLPEYPRGDANGHAMGVTANAGAGPTKPPRAAATARFPDRAAPATLDDALAIFATRADLSRLCVADERGPAPPNADVMHFASRASYDPRVAVEALHAARGALVRVGAAAHGHAGGAWEIAELAGGVASTSAKMALPVLRLFDRSGRVTERAAELGECSNSVPSLREWDAYVENCAEAAAAGAGPPPPRVGDVEAVRDALDWTFRRDNGGAGRVYDLPPPRAGGYGPPPFGFAATERGGYERARAQSDHHFYRRGGEAAETRVGQKRRPASPVAAHDRAPEGAPVARRRVEGALGARDAQAAKGGGHRFPPGAAAGASGPAALDRDPNESSWVVDTRGNNGLVVGVRGENVKRVERETGARVRCEMDTSTVVLSGAPAAVALARRMVEATLRQAGIEPGGAFGVGAPVPGEDRPGTSPGGDRVVDASDLRARLRGASAVDPEREPTAPSAGDGARPETRDPDPDPRDAEPAATVIDAPAPDPAAAGDDGERSSLGLGFVAAVDCGGPAGFATVVGDATDGDARFAALRQSCGARCSFAADEGSRRVVVRARDAGACAAAAEMVASIANREFTCAVTRHNLAARFRANLRAGEMLRASAEAGDSEAGRGCDVLVDVGKDLGAVIGPRGATIARLQKASACVMTADDNAKTVRVVGATPEMAKKGEEMIRAAIRKAAASAATRGSRSAGRGGRGRGRGRG